LFATQASLCILPRTFLEAIVFLLFCVCCLICSGFCFPQMVPCLFIFNALLSPVNSPPHAGRAEDCFFSPGFSPFYFVLFLSGSPSVFFFICSQTVFGDLFSTVGVPTHRSPLSLKFPAPGAFIRSSTSGWPSFDPQPRWPTPFGFPRSQCFTNLLPSLYQALCLLRPFSRIFH